MSHNFIENLEEWRNNLAEFQIYWFFGSFYHKLWRTSPQIYSISNIFTVHLVTTSKRCKPNLRNKTYKKINIFHDTFSEIIFILTIKPFHHSLAIMDTRFGSYPKFTFCTHLTREHLDLRQGEPCAQHSIYFTTLSRNCKKLKGFSSF